MVAEKFIVKKIAEAERTKDTDILSYRSYFFFAEYSMGRCKLFSRE